MKEYQRISQKYHFITSNRTGKVPGIFKQSPPVRKFADYKKTFTVNTTARATVSAFNKTYIFCNGATLGFDICQNTQCKPLKNGTLSAIKGTVLWMPKDRSPMIQMY